MEQIRKYKHVYKLKYFAPSYFTWINKLQIYSLDLYISNAD